MHEHAPAGVVGRARQIPLGLVHDAIFAHDRERVASVIRREDEVVAEPDRRVELGRIIVGRHVVDVARLDVADVQVVVTASVAQTLDRDDAPVGGHRRDAAVPAELEHQLVGRLEAESDDVEVDLVPPVGRVREHRAGCHRRGVHEPRVDHERLELRPLQQVQLCALVAALVDLHEHAPVRKKDPGHRLRLVGQLDEVAAARRSFVQLLRAGHGRADEEPCSVRRERERHRLPHLEQRRER